MMPRSVLSRRRRAFSLVEILVVITIIGILVAILIPTVGAARRSADRARTRTQFNQWAAAMELFKQEYGYYPPVAVSGKLDGERFSAALTGLTLAGNVPSNLYGNTKRLNFYQISESELDDSATALLDAFGNTDIGVRADLNRDGVINASDTGSGYLGTWPPVSGPIGGSFNPTATDPSLNTRALRASIVFYSAGRGNVLEDMILSWQP